MNKDIAFRIILFLLAVTLIIMAGLESCNILNHLLDTEI